MSERGTVHIVREAVQSEGGHLALRDAPRAGAPPDSGRADAQAPLFLDEPFDLPLGRAERVPDSPPLFLDEDDPGFFAEVGPGEAILAKVNEPDRTGVSHTGRRSLVRALVVVLAIIVVAGAGAYRARGGTAVALWRSLGFE